MWLPVVGFSGYEVSDEGYIRTTRARNGSGFSDPRPLTARKIKDKEYLRVTLSDQSGKQVDRKIHLLVLEAFIGPRPTQQHDGCHSDGNAINNRVSNLYWGTKQDNADDRVAHGTQVRGELQGLAKLSDAQVAEIKAAMPSWKRGSGRHFAKKFGVSDSTISAVKLGLTWEHI